MSVAECQEKCITKTGCTGITINGNGDCYRKSDIQLENCEKKTEFDTYIKSEWTKAKGFNCGTGHGAFDLEHPEASSAGNMSVAECQQLCKETSGCQGVTMKKSACFRRSYIELKNCEVDSEFETYVHDVTFYNYGKSTESFLSDYIQ